VRPEFTFASEGEHVAFTSRLLVIAVAVSCTACASSGRSWSQLPTPGRSRVVPGSWDRVESIRLGSPFVVTLKMGDRLAGTFKALCADVLILTDPAGKEFSIPRSEIARIVTQAEDRLASGAWIGAAVGLGTALAVLAIAGSGDGYVLPSAKWGAPLLLSGVGSLVGVLVDRAHKGKEAIYLAP
jgi:hypothetical protein